MNKFIRLLFCISLLTLGVAPLGLAQNARSSNITIIRGQPDYRGESYYYRRPIYRENPHYYRGNEPNIIIKIDTNDHDDYDRSRYGYPEQYRRGRGQTFYRHVEPSSNQDR